MKDATIIAACLQSREAYDAVRPFLTTKELSPMAAHWYPVIADWYDRDARATNADYDVVREQGLRRTNEKHRETLMGWFDSLPTDVSSVNAANELLDMKRFSKGHELASAIASNEEKKVPELVEDYRELLQATTLGNAQLDYGSDIDELEEVLSTANKVKLLPAALNAATDGGAIPGDHIILFGRTEIGKTLFTINMVAGFLRQDLRVLYVGNEDPINKIKARIVSNLSGLTTAQMREFPDQARDRARIKHYDNLVAVHLHHGSVADVEKLVKEHQPQVLVLDQIRNMQSAKSSGRDNITARLDAVAIDVRGLLAQYGLIGVSVTQAHAGEHGKPKVWLAADDVDSSRTGLPAQADLLIGIGADDDLLRHNQRAISLCKNKLGGSHEGFTVMVDPSRSKVL